MSYPADNPTARLEALDLVEKLATTKEERQMLARMRDRVRNGVEDDRLRENIAWDLRFPGGYDVS